MIIWREMKDAPGWREQVKVLWMLDWADDCKDLNPPLAEGQKYHVGQWGTWSSTLKGIKWASLETPEEIVERLREENYQLILTNLNQEQKIDKLAKALILVAKGPYPTEVDTDEKRFKFVCSVAEEALK